MHGRGHVWQGGVHGRWACVAGWGAAWQGACVACMPPAPGHHEIRSVNAQAVRILLECILVHHSFNTRLV